VPDELGGDVQQPLAKALGFGSGELTVKADELRPAEQVLGDQRDLEPGLVVLEVGLHTEAVRIKPGRDSGPESHRQARNGPRGGGDTSSEPTIETASTSLQMMATPRCRGSCRAPGDDQHPLGCWCPGREVQSRGAALTVRSRRESLCR
jgi:hypothetical protein